MSGQDGIVPTRVHGTAKKPNSAPAQKNDAMLRRSNAFAEALKDATRIDKTSIAEFADEHLLPVVRERYKPAVIREARRLSGKDGKLNASRSDSRRDYRAAISSVRASTGRRDDIRRQASRLCRHSAYAETAKHHLLGAAEWRF